MHSTKFNKRLLAKRIVLAALIVYNIFGIAFLLLLKHRRDFIEEKRKQYPYEAYSHGQALVGDYGTPLLFATQDLAQRYEREYGD